MKKISAEKSPAKKSPAKKSPAKKSPAKKSAAKKSAAKKSAAKKATAGPSASDFYRLRLYIAGQTPNSIVAIANLRKICEEKLKGKYRIEVVDLLEKPQLAKGDQIIAIPTLVRRLPPPVKRIIGNLSKTESVLVGLDLQPSC